jgi:hypothetical protein
MIEIAIGTKGRTWLCLAEMSVGHHVPGAFFVGLELRETYRGAIGAADLDVESPADFAPDGVGVIDGPQISCLDASLGMSSGMGTRLNCWSATRARWEPASGLLSIVWMFRFG